MSKGFNQQIAVGNLGKDAELVTVGSKDTPKLSFSVCANTGFGEHEHAEWFNVVVWGKRAEALHEYLTKGARVLVQGETRTRSWEDQDGQKHWRTEVVVTPFNGDVVLLGGNGGSGVDNADGYDDGEEEDEIPF